MIAVVVGEGQHLSELQRTPQLLQRHLSHHLAAGLLVVVPEEDCYLEGVRIQKQLRREQHCLKEQPRDGDNNRLKRREIHECKE